MSAGTPSFPTRRSGLVRDALFLLAGAAWVAAMYAVWQESRAESLTGGPGEVAVFTDAFEQNLRLLVTLRGPGFRITGEAVRRTKEPYDGKLVVRDRLRVRGAAMGVAGAADIDIETHWDRGAGGFRRTRGRLRLRVPGLVDTTIRGNVTRSRDARTGDVLVLRTDARGTDPRRSVTYRLPPGADVSIDLMPPAQVRPVRVGVRWATHAVNSSGSVTADRVEVVEKGTVSVAGTEMTAYRAVTRVEKETGRSVEVAETWYDADGRALVQTLRVSGAELTLERAERLAASDDEWEKMEMPDAEPSAGPMGGPE